MDKALLIGINKYPGCPLFGCCNDVDSVRQLLIDFFGFKPENIIVLKDGDATTSHIMMQIGAWVVQGTQAGDRVLLHYSGHGVQVPTGDPGEPDGLSEAICPVDFDWSAEHMITDKQFVATFSRMAPGVMFNWISDSCHSGDLDREMIPPKGMMASIWGLVTRAKSAPRRIPRLYPGSPHGGMVKVAQSRGMTPRGMVGGILDVGFVSGCMSTQTSADTRADGMACGALTHYLVKAIRSMPKDTPLCKIVASASQAMAAAGYAQRPQVDGARANRPLLG